MKKLLFSALIIVSTLVCLSPADAQASKNQNNVNCSKITQNTRNKSNTQSPNSAGQSKKCNNTVPGAKPADRGKPDNPTRDNTLPGAEPANRGKPGNPKPA